MQILMELPPEQAEALLAGGVVEDHPAGAVILREGERGDAMYLVQSGTVQAYHQADDGRIVVLERVGPGHQVGEMALLRPDGRRNASVRAFSDVRLLRISHAALQAVLATDHPLKRRMHAHGEAQLIHSLTRRSSLVRALGDAGIRVTQRRLVAGEVLVRKGAPPGPAYVVVQGSIVHRDEADPTLVRWRTGEGSCVGERSVLEDEPRALTLHAETDTTVLEIDAEALRALVGQSPEWQRHIGALRRVYSLPRLGYVTQLSGEVEGSETLTTIYHLPDDRRVVFTRVVGRSVSTVDVTGSTAVEEVSWAADGAEVTLFLASSGELVGARVQGAWPGQVALSRRILEAPLLLPDELVRFEHTGMLPGHGAIEALACACLVVPEQRVRACIAAGADTLPELQAELGCGTVCGGCVPGLAALLSDEGWTRARLTTRDEVAPGVFQLDIRPLQGERAPALPGQYVVVRAELHGYPVQRAYTLLRADASEGWQIAVKREPRGVFSRWLTGVDLPAAVEVSPAGGEVVLRDDMARVVCLVAGIGVTPAVALAREVAERGLTTRLHIVYTAREHHAFGELLLGLAASCPYITVRLRRSASEGRLSSGEISELARSWPDAWFYLCGPTAFLAACQGALVDGGVPAGRLLVEVFTPSAGRPGQHDTPIQARSGDRPGAPDWTPTSALFAPPRRWRGQAGRLLQYTMRAQRMLWQRMASPLTGESRADPRLPVLTLGAARSYLHGLEKFAMEQFGVLEQRYGQATDAADPHEPDGDTFVVLTAHPGLVVDAPVPPPWRRLYPDALLPIHATRSPTVVRHVLESGAFDRGPMPFHFLQQVLGATEHPEKGDTAGVLVGRHEGNPTWRDDRQLGLQALVPSRLERAAAQLPEVLRRPLDALAERVEAGHRQPFDAHRFTARLALRMVVSVLFGASAVDEVERAAAPIAETAMGLGDIFEDLFARRISAADARVVHQRTFEAVMAIREAVRRAEPHLPPDEASLPLVRRVLDTPDDERSQGRLFALLAPLLVAGHETTGTLMAWALYVLGRDDAMRNRVVGEIDAWGREHGAAPVGLVAQTHRPETLALLFELYRFYPPVAQTIRTACRPGEVPPGPSGRGGFAYVAETPVMVSVVAVHRDPRRWSRPDAFAPDRFLEGVHPDATPEERGRQIRRNARRWEDAWQLIPFLKGPAACIGRGLNQIEVFAFLDALHRRFTIQLSDRDRVVEARGSTISAPPPGAIAVTASLRS